MQRFFSLRKNSLLFAIITICQEIIQLDGCGLLPGLLKCDSQAFDDLRLPGGGRPGNGEQDWGPARSDNFLNTPDEANVTVDKEAERIGATSKLETSAW